MFFLHFFLCALKTIKSNSSKPRRSKNKTALYMRTFERNITLSNLVKQFFSSPAVKVLNYVVGNYPEKLLRDQIKPYIISA